MLVFSLAVIVAVIVFDGCASKKSMLHIPTQESPPFIHEAKTSYSLSIMRAVDSRVPSGEKDTIDKWLDRPVSDIVTDNLKAKFESLGLFQFVSMGGHSDYMLETEILEFSAPIDQGFWKVELVTKLRLKCRLIETNTGFTLWEGQVSASRESGKKSLVTWDWVGQAFSESMNQASNQLVNFIIPHIEVDPDVPKPTDYSNRSIIHWKIDSEPQGAVILYSIVSQTDEIESSMEMYLDRTPLEITQPAVLSNLNPDKYHLVTIVIVAKKSGYYSQRKEINMKTIAEQARIRLFFDLVKED